jgi:PRC-barrel domain
MFDRLGDLWRVGADYRRNGFAAIQVVGCALVIAIATAANPSTGQAPTVDDGAHGSNETTPGKGASLQQFSQADLRRILGKEVRSASGQAMGRIVDLLVDEGGQPRAAIIDFGGFLGVGTRKIAIDWNTLRFDTAKPSAAVVVALDPDEIKAAPEYKESRDVVAVVSNRRDITPYPGW